MNKWFNPKSFIDLIERFNPFGFKKEDGDTQAFKNYREAYLYAMKKLYLQFPRGYCDMALFVEAQTKIPFADALRVVKQWKSMGVEEVMLIELENADNDRRLSLMLVMKALHTISETKFNEAMFMEALQDFDLWLETEKLKKVNEYIEENG